MNFEVFKNDDDVKQLLKKVKQNTVTASKLRNEIKKMTTLHKQKQSTKTIEVRKKQEIETPKKETNNDFEREVSFYIDSYNDIDDSFTSDDLIELLPSEDNYDFKDIVLRLQAESLKYIKEISEIIIQDNDLSKNELNEYKNEITKEKRKIDILSRILVKTDTIPTEPKEKNDIILVPTKFGNIRIIEELKQISSEYYPRFLELINSIIDGSFKNVRAFTNNSGLNGIYEVKGNQVRLIFTRVGKNAYSLIDLFIKKDMYATHHYDSLKVKVAEYRHLHNKLKEKTKDEDFMKENNKYVQELFDLIDPKADIKQLRKDGSNE